MERTKWDAAIIGGGLAGLIAAIELARGARSVVLLEKSSRMGGRAITNNKNGALLNLGGHALYRAGAAYAILKELGLRLEGGAPSPKFGALWNNQVVPMPATLGTMMSSKLLSWSGKMQLMKVMMKLAKMDASRIPDMSLRAWAEAELSDPMVRHMLYSLCRTASYAKDPDYQLAGDVLAQVQRSLKGVLYLHGGWQSIVDQLQDQAVRAGVHIVSGRDVKEIVQEEGRVRGLKLSDDGYIETAHVISTASPAETYKLVDGAERTILKRWKDEARPAMAACLDLGLRKLPVKGRDIALGLDQPIFFSHHTVNARLSDNGTLVVHLIKYNGPGGGDPQADERLLTEAMSTLHPGWEQEVVARQFLPNITVVHDTLNIARSSRVTGPTVEGVRGLYVAGDWVTHGEMLADASAASAKRAADAIFKSDRLA
ncbi:phytoene desaturase family protein [Paenibacillus sp. GCM10023248]|uniref:phytoene desaturase family protein n=1 Tax=Bacillales TaxID=1385 RepID=UPI002378598F|nr:MULTISPECIES: FAD-dependent oxidoreductase [Bacillales]MDD9271131.1 FAD-dependent oxidoreductase [Paenibacillus sp. MAHUQ-63]MDR6885102.1 phytoene dehydrogenase-like protein [Bacillus sp. 3255]